MATNAILNQVQSAVQKEKTSGQSYNGFGGMRNTASTPWSQYNGYGGMRRTSSETSGKKTGSNANNNQSHTDWMAMSNYVEKNKDVLEKEFGATNVALVSGYLELNKAYEPFEGTDAYQSFVGYNELMANSEQYIQDLGESGFYQRLAVEASKAQDKLDVLFDTYKKEKHRFPFSKLAEKYPTVMRKYSYDPTNPEDMNRKAWDFTPLNLDWNEIAEEYGYSPGKGGWNADKIIEMLDQAQKKETQDFAIKFGFSPYNTISDGVNEERGFKGRDHMDSETEAHKEIIREMWEGLSFSTRNWSVPIDYNTETYYLYAANNGIKLPTAEDDYIDISGYFESNEYKLIQEIYNQQVQSAYSDYTTPVDKKAVEEIYGAESTEYLAAQQQNTQIEENNKNLDLKTVEYMKARIGLYSPSVQDSIQRIIDNYNEVSTLEQIVYAISFGRFGELPKNKTELTDEEKDLFESVRRTVFGDMVKESIRAKEEADDTTALAKGAQIVGQAFFEPMADLKDLLLDTNNMGLNSYYRDAEKQYQTNVMQNSSGYSDVYGTFINAASVGAELMADVLIGKAMGGIADAVSDALGYNFAAGMSGLLPNEGLATNSVIEKIASNDMLKGMMVARFADAYGKYSSSGLDENSAVIYSLVDSVGTTYIEGLGGIGSRTGGMFSSGLLKAPKTTVNKIFSKLFEYGTTVFEEYGEEELQAGLQGVLESSATGVPFADTSAVQEFAPENIGSTTGTIAMTVALFTLFGMPAKMNINAKPALSALEQYIDTGDRADFEQAKTLTSEAIDNAIESGLLSQEETDVLKKIKAQIVTTEKVGTDSGDIVVDVQTRNGEILVPEPLEIGAEMRNIDYGRMSSEQMDQSVQSNIQTNLQTQPEVVQKALIEGMSALINIETRLRTESRNANYSGFNVDASQTAYMDFQTAEGTVKGSSTKLAKLVTAAEAMAADIKAAFETGQLTETEAGKLWGVLTGIVGDAELAQAYVDSRGGKGDNKNIVSPSVKLTTPTLPEGGKPKGKYAAEQHGEPGRAIKRQNESADTLALQGYDVTMLPETKGGNGYGIESEANPDFLIGFVAFDCYAPISRNTRNIWSEVRDKTQKQARRIILNLNDYRDSVDVLYKQFVDWPIDTLDELLVIQGETIIRWIP